MIKRLGLLIVANILAGAVWALAISDRQVKDVLSRLDSELDGRQNYIAQRQSRIDSIYALLDTAADKGLPQLELIKRLADEYTAFNTDSALYYCSQGYDLSLKAQDDSMAVVYRLHRVTLLPLVGFIDGAVGEYGGIVADSVPGELWEMYYDAGRQMYSYIASFYLNFPSEHSYWNSRANECQMQLIPLLDVGTPKYKLNRGEYYFTVQEYSKARATFVDLLRTVAEDSNIYARAAHKMAELARLHDSKNELVYYLALSAIADIRSATLEVVSLQELGEELFERGDIARAHTYMSVALASAAKCNAMMRMVQSSAALPIIDSAHRAELEEWRNHIYAIIGVLAFVLLLLVATLLFLRREMRRMRVLQHNLKTANHTKEVYISQFLNLCSIYMDKLQQFNKLVNRKISSGNVDDLYRITKSGKFVEEQSKEFYEIFDNAFLHIYPDFVEQVNRLLRPGEQIVIQAGERLNTDLRLLAFMRLGIDEGTRIAQVLNYSVNTIYAYRNRLRNKAINRETFETDVMAIT